MYFSRLDYSSIYKIHLGALMLIMMIMLSIRGSYEVRYNFIALLYIFIFR